MICFAHKSEGWAFQPIFDCPPHRERWRERPFDTSATSTDLCRRCQVRQTYIRLEDEPCNEMLTASLPERLFIVICFEEQGYM